MFNVYKNYCPNATNGRHKWLDKIGKNKNKPDQCVLCNTLKQDIDNLGDKPPTQDKGGNNGAPEKVWPLNDSVDAENQR